MLEHNQIHAIWTLDLFEPVSSLCGTCENYRCRILGPHTIISNDTVIIINNHFRSLFFRWLPHIWLRRPDACENASSINLKYKSSIMWKM